MVNDRDEKNKPLHLPIGEDDFKELITKNYTYIDKTLLIQEFLDNGAKVILITRPRRFGKSIALSMLRYFFEKTDEPTAHLFAGCNIWKDKKFQEIQGTYPVIYISFKDIKSKTWEGAYEELKNLLSEEVYRTLHALEPQMDEYHKRKYELLVKKSANMVEFSESLLFITKVFKKHYQTNTIILIDEYDSPITQAYLHKFYEEMTDFMRQTLSKALKGNENLYRGFLTGVVRTAKDGILSGLNNLDIYTMLDSGFSDKFGFTETETNELLEKSSFLDKKEELTSWYNGYVFGSKHSLSTKIYNPWSVLQYIKHSCIPETYWARTGSVALLEKLISGADETTQKELKTLLEGNSLESKEINQDVILLDLSTKKRGTLEFFIFCRLCHCHTARLS